MVFGVSLFVEMKTQGEPFEKKKGPSSSVSSGLTARAPPPVSPKRELSKKRVTKRGGIIGEGLLSPLLFLFCLGMNVVGDVLTFIVEG